MKIKFCHICLLAICILSNRYTYAQIVSDSSIKDLTEVLIAFNKWEQKKNEVPNKIAKVDLRDSRLRNPQTTADLLGQSGGVFIQKSQMGGGSPMIRGFATNRVLIVADGVRMNNAIYRSGNNQNIISIDPLSLQDAEVIFGPGSIIYGSDAIGGVMDFHTLTPQLATDKPMIFKGSAVTRFSTANQENTVHADINAGSKKWSLLSSFTYSSFNDLKMGKHGGQDSYLRPEYIERINGVDSIVKNSEPRIQRFSGYNQTNFLQKIRFKPTDYLDLQYSFTYGGTGIAPRYDRLIQYRQGKLRFAEWNYGPMLWRMHILQVSHNRKNTFYDESRLIAGYQDYAESRIYRPRDNNNQNTQSEKVKATNINWDLSKAIGKGQLFYGLEYVYNKVGSSGFSNNINSGVVTPFVSRYPDGSTWSTAGIYGSYKVNPIPRLTLLIGLRYNYNRLQAEFDTTFFKLPYRDVVINDGALTGNAGLVFRPGNGWQLNGNISTGFRMPNVDDVGKFFESTPGNITVPNPNLESEYAWNVELGIVKNINRKLRVEINGFHTILDNAIVRRPFTLNGQDSIFFGGINSRVEALQNVSKATVWGLQVSAEINLSHHLTLQSFANWITGKETDDINDEQVPLRHAPPFYGNTNLRYNFKKLFLEFSSFYNSQIKNEDLAPSEQAKTEIYAKDENGNPFSPSWYILNLKASYQLNLHLALTAGWENMTNQRYRPYSSGIVAAGTNFIVSVRAKL
ncbi:MAG: TonB-dependent receptor [Chitinophagaceae bacterium]